jgi:hypothetical protein
VKDAKLSEAESFKIVSLADAKTKRAFYVELLSLVQADNTHGSTEVAIIKEIQTKLDLSDAFAKEAATWLTDYLAISQKGYALVAG